MTHRSIRDIGWDIWWGLQVAARIAGFFALIAIVGRLVLGSDIVHGITFTALLYSYAILGVVGGLLAGILRPLTRSKAGSAVVGALWGLVLCLVIRVPVIGWGHWQMGDLVLTPFFVVVGAFFGVGQRRISDRIEAKRRMGHVS